MAIFTQCGPNERHALNANTSVAARLADFNYIWTAQDWLYVAVVLDLYSRRIVSLAGEVWDNSAMESFFGSMKTERIARKVYRSRELARADVFDYITTPGVLIRRRATSVQHSSRKLKKLRLVST